MSWGKFGQVSRRNTDECSSVWDQPGVYHLNISTPINEPVASRSKAFTHWPHFPIKLVPRRHTWITKKQEVRLQTLLLFSLCKQPAPLLLSMFCRFSVSVFVYLFFVCVCVGWGWGGGWLERWRRAYGTWIPSLLPKGAAALLMNVLVTLCRHAWPTCANALRFHLCRDERLLQGAWKTIWLNYSCTQWRESTAELSCCYKISDVRFEEWLTQVHPTV